MPRNFASCLLAGAALTALAAPAALAQNGPEPGRRVVVVTTDDDGLPEVNEFAIRGEDAARALAWTAALDDPFILDLADDPLGVDDEDRGPRRAHGPRAHGPEPRAPVTKKDAEKRWKERFAAFDLDGNGKVSADELVAYQEKKRAERRRRMAERHLSRFDANGDGVVTDKEFREFHEKRFAAVDANGDGVITPEERRAAIHKRMAELRQKMGKLRREMRRMRMHMMHHGMMGDDRDVEIIIDRDGGDEN